MDKLGKFYQKAFEENRPLIGSRYRELFTACCKFEVSCQNRYGKEYVSFFCSTERLESAVISYFYDIYRYKDFHGMLDKGKESNINFPKIFAFTIKWFLREKPLYLKVNNEAKLRESDPNTYKSLVKLADRINEEFIIHWVNLCHFGHFNRKTSIDSKERKNLIYNLKFRDISTGHLEMYLSGKVNNGAIKPA